MFFLFLLILLVLLSCCIFPLVKKQIDMFAVHLLHSTALHFADDSHSEDDWLSLPEEDGMEVWCGGLRWGFVSFYFLLCFAWAFQLEHLFVHKYICLQIQIIIINEKQKYDCVIIIHDIDCYWAPLVLKPANNPLVILFICSNSVSRNTEYSAPSKAQCCNSTTCS